MEMRTCNDCGNEAHVFRDDAYGSDGTDEENGEWYCDICYASTYFPDEIAVYACREGINGEIRFIPDQTEAST